MGSKDEETDDIEVEVEEDEEVEQEWDEEAEQDWQARMKLINPRHSGYVCYVDNDSGKKGTIGWIQVDDCSQKIFFHSQNFMEQFMETMLSLVEDDRLMRTRVTFYVDTYKTKTKDMLTALAIRPEQDILIRRKAPTNSGKGKKGGTNNKGKGKGKGKDW